MVDDDQLTQAGPVSAQYDQATGDPEHLVAGATDTTIGIDALGALASQSTTAQTSSGAQAVLAEQVVRDRLDRITQRTVTDDSGAHVYGYAYDPRGHLTQVTKDGATIESYTYDSSGGLTSRGSGLLSSWITTDGHGRPTSAADGTSASWNSDGELQTLTTSAGQSQMAYDGLGRLTQVTLPDGRVGRYRYDALGRRVAVRLDGQLVRRFVYGASLWPQARIDADGDVLERYIYASQAHVPDVIARRDGQRLRLVLDVTGSVRAAVDADTGVVLQRLSYDAYGRVTQDTNPGLQPFGYKGSVSDPVAEGAGLVWMGVRAYTPKLARFTTPDPVGLKAGWNQHDALAGDPVNGIDADGRFVFAVPLLAAGGAAIAGLIGYVFREQLAQLMVDFFSGLGVCVDAMNPFDDDESNADDAADAADAATDAVTGGDGPGAKPPFKKQKSGSGKDKATDVPSWARNHPEGRPRQGENGNKFADRMMNEKYGEGNWGRKGQQGREHNQLRKWGDRGFE